MIRNIIISPHKVTYLVEYFIINIMKQNILDKIQLEGKLDMESQTIENYKKLLKIVIMAIM